MIKKIPEIDTSKIRCGKTPKQIAQSIESSVVFNNSVLESISSAVVGINEAIDLINELSVNAPSIDSDELTEVSGKVESLSKEVKSNREEHCREINILSNKLTRINDEIEGGK